MIAGQLVIALILVIGVEVERTEVGRLGQVGLFPGLAVVERVEDTRLGSDEE